MKKISLIMSLLIVAGILTGCSNSNGAASSESSSDSGKSESGKKLSIVTTIFPEYDWVRQILGDKADGAELKMLLDNGVGLHSYQPTADDIISISDCDLFIYVGGESDGWVDDALKNATNPNMEVIDLLDVLGDSVKNEEAVEGMQEEDEHDHGHSHDEEITEDDIKDRELSDFAGEWKSLYPYLLNGELDEYCEHKAEEDDDDSTTKETYIEKYKTSWQCDADKVSIKGDKITFTYSDGKTCTAEYAYAGYQIKRGDDGSISSVRYQFTTDNEAAPKYVQFNDHGHEPGAAEHFHIYFGNDGFDSLMDSKTNPFFVGSSLSVDEILDELMGHEHEEEKDEHVWLSLRNSETLCQSIADALGKLDPDNGNAYQQNASDYISKLSALDSEYKGMVDSAARKTILFGDRFPFRYLVDDYGLDYYAAFVGCSAETEASFETISFLAGKVDELGLPCVLTIEGVKHKIAETVVQNTASKDQKILAMDSMQSTTSDDVKNGATYYSIMEKNLEVLREALN